MESWSVFLYCFLLFVFGCVVYGILVPRPGIELVTPAMEAQCLKPWSSREVPMVFFLLSPMSLQF